jgi:mono/diheme cytochrome c family protein/rhodanese-related sulfurtransferase
MSVVNRRMSIPAIACGFILLTSALSANAAEPLTEARAAAADTNYLQYCALCHGEDREGHVNDHAPSLRSKSLIETGYPWAIAMAIGYGRAGTPMAPFVDDVGGPLTRQEIRDMTQWLFEQANVDKVDIHEDPIPGDIMAGARIYQSECAQCHGAEGEGITGTALGNQAMLALTPDAFLRHAIANGRQDTEMVGFAAKLSEADMDNVTAFLRSRATGWNLEKPVYRAPPPPEEYVLNPDGDDPGFELQDDLYITSAQLDAALQAGKKMVLLDTRALPLWQMANIEGSVPLPYYYDYKNLEALAADLPRDGTMIVTYCECPRAAAEFVNRKLKEQGFENLAVLYEGIQGWIALGYPVLLGETIAIEAKPMQESSD